MNRGLLALYPRGWQHRYGSEVADLAEELIAAGETTPTRAALGLFAGAAVERWRVSTSRAVLTPAAAAAAAACGIALAVSHTLNGAAATRPYFDAHQVGVLLPVIELGWLLMELTEFVRGRRSRHWRDRAARAGQRGFWLTVGFCVAANTLVLYLAPPVIPGAAIRPGGAAFGVGVGLLISGLGLRGWSFRALRGRYFNFAIMVSPDQTVVQRPVPPAAPPRPRRDAAGQHGGRADIRELGGRGGHGAAAAGGHRLAHPRRGERAADGARRGLPLLRLWPPPPRPADLVTAIVAAQKYPTRRGSCNLQPHGSC